VFGVFLVFFGEFGSAIPAVRDAHDGWLDEVFRAGYPPGRWLMERTLAETGIDLLQTLPVVLLLLWSAGGLRSVGVVSLGLASALMFANLLGPLLAAAVRSLAEAALACAAVSLTLLHYAGFFRVPSPGWTSTVARWNPYAPLRAALQAGVSGLSPGVSEWVGGLVTIGFVGLLIVATATLWSARLRWPLNR